MNTKSIVISLVVIIIVVAIGGYLIYTSMNNSGAPAPAQQQTAPTTSDQTDQTKVQAQDVKVGTGKTAQAGDTVSVLYEGRFADGTIFDSSAAHGNKPLTFVLGAQGLIPGFQIGVNGMKEGGQRVLAIPSTLGYGSEDFKDPATGKVIIPANSTLVFKVELVKVVTGTAPKTTP